MNDEARHEGPDALAPPLRLAGAADLTAVYRAYRVLLVGYARRLTGDADVAHDVVQDVFVKLWEKRETLAVETSLQALLYTMTRNRALNDNRRRAHLAADVDVDDVDGETMHAADSFPVPDAALEAEDLGRHLGRLIAALPPRRAEAFTLSRFDGLSHAEIARVMDLSVRTVDTHVVHALRDLRRHLDALHAIRRPSTEP